MRVCRGVPEFWIIAVGPWEANESFVEESTLQRFYKFKLFQLF